MTRIMYCHNCRLVTEAEPWMGFWRCLRCHLAIAASRTSR